MGGPVGKLLNILLTQYYKLKYRPGTVTQNADLLSRRPEGGSVGVLAVERGPLGVSEQEPHEVLPDGQGSTFWRDCQQGDREL